MPNPGVGCCPWSKIWLTIVLYLGGETEEATVGAGVGFVSTAGQTAFLVGALQRVHGPILQVGGLFNNCSTKNQVWGRWQVENIKEQCLASLKLVVYGVIFILQSQIFSYQLCSQVWNVGCDAVLYCVSWSYSKYRRRQQQSVHLLWDTGCVFHDVDTDPETARILNISRHSSALYQSLNLLASTTFPDKRNA